MRGQTYRTFLLLGFVAGLSACQAPDSSDRIQLTPQDSVLADVMNDLHVVDAESFTRAEEAGTEEISVAGRDSVLAAYGFTEESFMATVEPLVLEPARLLAIYNLALDRSPAR